VFPGGYVVAKSGTDVPHVTTVIGADIYDPTRSVSAHRNWLVRQGVKKALAHASAVTSDSRDMADRTRELFPNQEVTPIPLGVPSLCPDGRTRSELDLPEDAFVVVSVARLVKRKRLDVLLEAVSRIHDPLVYTVIMGSGPAEEPLMALSEALGISERVRFSGWVSEADKSAYLANAELFCLPSEHEGFGLVFIESMSVGTPVITTGVGGQNDIIRDGTDGFLTKAGDAEDLREKMCLLIADRDLLEAMRTSVLQHSKTFLPARTAEQYLSIYSKYTPVTSHRCQEKQS